ncbi:MAG: polyprenyl synthetase family protein [Actinobacteria bacterium]|nr:polyprenyl synthetase family protein [Actinomycetota bacterium]
MSDTRAFQALVDTVGADVTARLSDVERRLAEIVEVREPRAAEPGLETLRAGGKRLRPLLVLVCGAIDLADEERSAALIRAAAAVELVHMATLVHDDVLDDAALRRGRPTVYAEHGREAALTTGDLLFALAFDELARPGDEEQVAALSYASSGLARGELIQREDAFDISVTRERYLLRCTLKTARLFEAAALLGAHAGGRPGIAPVLAAFGNKVGLAFQLADDVLDVVASTEQIGKTRGADLLDGTVNLPLIEAALREPSLAALDLREIDTPERAAEVCDSIVATGAPEAVLDEARKLVAEAKDLLRDTVGVAERAMFATIADQAVARSK